MATRWSLTIDCAYPAKLAEFWALALGYVHAPPPAGFGSWEEWLAQHGVPQEEWDDGAYLVDPAGMAPGLSFLKVPEPKVAKNRLHLDVQVGGGRDDTPWEVRWPRVIEAVERLTGSLGCEADTINNNGQIAGICYDTSFSTHLVLWSNGTVTDLGTLGTPGNVQIAGALSINNNGQIAGSIVAGDGFLYSNGTITGLGGFLAAAINDNGVIVGGPSIDAGGTVQNLNNLIPAGSSYQIQNATAINDNGQIVANATNTATGQTHALLLTPS